ncbi:hypothetical protein J45TS6_42020 [Paenibacillus sp. J45TS6]|uniref:GNAT family N-acetyltransferase n=1 Tax=Paenibacillus sp. J45TS6 TaxID=2807196 RepID=UPI001B18F53B|nr:GNAT family N-acetyltransferase [Paenibacillus sp. J45TS6]GIP45743.1 hypothetical protein J45TS6_42020 [Paenibacillus sp. J45TS6]
MIELRKITFDNFNECISLRVEEYQQNGYGKEAIVRAIELIKTFPHGDASKIVIVYGEENKIAKKLYTSLGFIENGERDEDGDILAEYIL